MGVTIHGEGVTAHLSPLEQAGSRLHKRPGRPIKWTDTDDGLKPGLRGQALAFCQAIRSGLSPVLPASDLRDHARSIQLANQLNALKNVNALKNAPEPACLHSFREQSIGRRQPSP